MDNIYVNQLMYRIKEKSFNTDESRTDNEDNEIIDSTSSDTSTSPDTSSFEDIQSSDDDFYFARDQETQTDKITLSLDDICLIANFIRKKKTIEKEENFERRSEEKTY